MKTVHFNRDLLDDQIKAWLQEDIGTGDITTLATVPEQHQSNGMIHCKESGILAGLPIAQAVFQAIDPTIRFSPRVEEGMRIEQGTVIAEVKGATRCILMGERLALNLLQRLSGIATQTQQYVQAVAGLKTSIVDTRKTTPGHRMLEKYAVQIGGGMNHRFGLYDAVLIKDNHLKAAGGIRPAIEAARRAIPHTMKIEVEVEKLEEVMEALQANADIILLDNMPLELLREAVQRIKQQAPHVITEASGGITMQTVREIAETGVDVISVGSLTHSIQALDISLDLFGVKEGLS